MTESTSVDVVDRRGLMRRGAGAVLLALAGGTALNAAHADSAEALAGDPLILGQDNTGGATTVHVPSLVIDSGFDGPALSATSIGAAFSASTAIGTAITANGGVGVPLRLAGGPSSMPPTSGTFTAGSFALDGFQQLWYCVQSGSGTASRWLRLSTASLFIFPAPFRVYDSRGGQPNPSGSPTGALSLGDPARVINCQPAVPSGATAILFNLTIVETVGAGALLVWSDGVSEPLASSINWGSGGQVIANGVTSACSASRAVQARVTAGVAGARTEFLLDVIGYYA